MGEAAVTNRTPAIMFQGLSSNSGKSILTAAVCRILVQDGLRPVPFKAQNMSLNSFVTRDGKEMGRAQMVQARASRLEPDARMNPILLKPAGSNGSQIIVRGAPVGTLDFSGYTDRRDEMRAIVREDYDALSEEGDVVIMEGAGSPAEVNLKARCIANMDIAKYASAKVLLVGDIDRGGVFASFVGTMEILDPWERDLVVGYVINRFRGDVSLLGDALAYLEQRTDKPVLGTVPFVSNLGIPDEDSVAFKETNAAPALHCDDKIQVAIIDLPHISNTGDFDPFVLEPDVDVTVVREASQFFDADIVILPGTKNVMADLEYLKKTCLAEKIRKAGDGTALVGICGGFQMLGEAVRDPHGIESTEGSRMEALGIMPVSTALEEQKTLLNTTAMHNPSGNRLRGYEIHHGQTETSGLVPTVVREDGEVIGVQTEDGRVQGTYLHGFFDDDKFRRWFIDGAREKKGLTPLGRVVAPYDLEPALDRLADVVRANLDIAAVYKLAGIR